MQTTKHTWAYLLALFIVSSLAYLLTYKLWLLVPLYASGMAGWWVCHKYDTKEWKE